MNDATLKMLAELKEAMKKKEEAEIARLAERQAERQKKKEATREKQQKLKEYLELRLKGTQQRIREPIVEPDTSTKRKRQELTPGKLARVGMRIEGSSLFRDFCVSCGEAIRVVDPGISNVCLDCRPTGCPGVRNCTIITSDIEYNGSRFHSAEW